MVSNMSRALWMMAAAGGMAIGAGGALGQDGGDGGAAAQQAAVARNAVPLIPRDVFFGNPDFAAVRMSPDGTRISYLAEHGGVLNVFVGPIDDPSKAQPVTDATARPIMSYYWAFTNNHIIYMKDKGGDENFHVYSVNLTTGESKDLTPYEQILDENGQPVKWPDGRVARPRATVQEMSRDFPSEILVSMNTRDPRFSDLFRVNIETGETELVQRNDGVGGGFAGFVTDDSYNVRFATRLTADGGTEILKPAEEGKHADVEDWAPFMKISMEDSMTTGPEGFDKSGDVLYMLDSRGRDTAALRAMNLETGEERTIAADDRADIGGVLADPIEHTIEAYSVNYLRNEWVPVGDAIAADLKYLESVDPGELVVTSRTTDDRTWMVAYLRDDGPVRYYKYERNGDGDDGEGKAGKATFLFTNRKELEQYDLASMHPVVIKSRDGLDLVSYLTLPTWADTDGDGRPSEPLPMVLLVHGGPWARDAWGYNGTHQWLANRGYAVLSVNYRGSTGFGKEFINAGNLEWAGKMHDDLIDAVSWAVDEGIAHPERVGIMGGSYGGYATLVGLTFTPEEFACGVDIVGPSSILTLIETIPPYWEPAIELFAKRVGDHRTEEGRAFLTSRSPLTFVGNITKPLLIGQGANDPRVKQAEADQIVSAMQAKGIPVTYVVYPDEGHGFARAENNTSFNAVAEAFLAEHLGGRYEPIGDDLEGSSITVPVGAGQVPGLSDALGE